MDFKNELTDKIMKDIKNHNEVLIKITTDNSNIGVIGSFVDSQNYIYMANDRIASMLGYDSVKDMICHTKGVLFNIIHKDDLNKLLSIIDNDIYIGKEYELNYRMKCKDGSFIWVKDKGKIVNTEENKLAIICFCTFLSKIDINSDSMAINPLVELLDESPQVIQIIDSDTLEILYANKTANEYTKTIDISYLPKNCYRHILDNNTFETSNDKTTFIVKTKKIIWEGKEAFVVFATDITEVANLRNKFKELSVLDPLTGFYNRNYQILYDLENQELLPAAYFVCDCNNLKNTNDMYGHEAGDKYIIETSKLIKKVMPQTAVNIRTGGDEFLSIVSNCDETKAKEIVNELNIKQQEIKKEIPYFDLACGYKIRTSLEVSEKEIIDQADSLMYNDKKQKKEFMKKI